MRWDFDEAVVVDVETTGLSPYTDRVVSVSALRARFSNLNNNPDGLHIEELVARVNPERDIPAGASRIHGIYNNDVVEEPTFKEIARTLRDFIGSRPIIAHNAQFDKSFLNAEFERAAVETLDRNGVYCTMLYFRGLTGKSRGSNLDNVAKELGVGARNTDTHDAYEDTQLTLKIACKFYLMENAIQTVGLLSEPGFNS